MFQKSKKYHSILIRISIWFLLLGIVSITAISYSMEILMRLNMEKRITQELLRVEENARLYVCQILMLHNNQLNREGFIQFINDIEEQFKSAGYQEIAFYDTEGKLIGSSGERFLKADQREDFELAMERKSAFTLHYGVENACEVYFTMPVRVRGEQLGLICFYLDYHEIYEREWNTFRNMIYGIVLVFGVVYMIIWLMVRGMVAPIRRLADISKDISRQFEDGKLSIQMLGGQKFYRRRDEIGELARNYRKMLDVTKEQFEKIEQDREHILQLMDSRQEFYNSITHELKTPLAIISGYTQLIEENGLSDTELFHSGMRQILQESERLHRMVIQLLEMQDKEESAFVPVDMAEVVTNAAELMRMKAERYGNKLVLHIEAGSHQVKGRKDRLLQVLINLIDNAIKYGESEKEIQIRLKEETQMVSVEVHNQGKGIDEQELSQIFEPFFRVDKERSRELGSAGLGLSIAKKIMDEHGGRIAVKSVPMGDTVFSLFLPVFNQAG